MLPPASSVRRLPAGAKLQLPVTLMLIGVLALILSFAALAFGLLSFSSIHYVRNKPAPTPVAPVAPSAPTRPEADFESIEKHLREVQARAQQLDENEQQAQTRIASLEQEQVQLTQAIEQRQSALRDGQSDLRRLENEQQRIRVLRAEAAALERRIAELQASIEAVRQRADTRHAEQPTTPQVVECVRGGIVLEPQETQIPIARLRSGVLASLARQRGVYFLVRPTGFESFIEARNIARGAGKVVGYEPTEPGVEDR